MVVTRKEDRISKSWWLCLNLESAPITSADGTYKGTPQLWFVGAGWVEVLIMSRDSLRNIIKCTHTHTQNKTLFDLPPTFSFPECYVFEVTTRDPGNMTTVSNLALFVPVSTLSAWWWNRAQIPSSPVS